MPSILHLSDLHRTPHELVTQLRVLREAASRDGLPERFDFVVVSGDLVDRPALADYDSRRDFLVTHVRPLLRVDDPRRIIVVPGNHDVCYTEGDAAMQPVALCDISQDALAKAIEAHRIDPATSPYRFVYSPTGTLSAFRVSDSVAYARRFSLFDAFLRSLYTSAIPAHDRHFELGQDVSRHWSCHAFPTEGIAFFGFNSAYGIDRRNPHAARVSQAAAAAAAGHLADLRKHHPRLLAIAVWHHGLASDKGRLDFVPQEDVAEIFGQGFSALLHGHVHFSSLDQQNALGRSVPVCGVGSLGAGPADRPSVGNQIAVLTVNEAQVSHVYIDNSHHKQTPAIWRRSFRLESAAPRRTTGVTCDTHVRKVKVHENGVCEVRVELRGIHGTGVLPLASFMSHRVRMIVRDVRLEPSGRVLEQSQGPLVAQSPDVGKAALVHVTSEHEGETLVWSYLVPNVVPLSQEEAEYYDEKVLIGDRLLPAFGHWIAMECRTYQSTIELPMVPTSTRAFAQRHATTTLWRTAIENAPVETGRIDLTDNGNGVFSLTVEQPLVGHKYGIAFDPPPDREAIGIAGAQSRASEWLRHVMHLLPVRVVSLRQSWVQRVMLFLGRWGSLALGKNTVTKGLVPKTFEKVEWMMQVWHHESRDLVTAFHEGPQECLRYRFRWGDGVSGHALRSGRIQLVKSLGSAKIHKPNDEVPRATFLTAIDGQVLDDRARPNWFILAIPILLVEPESDKVQRAGVFCMAGEHDAGIATALRYLDEPQHCQEIMELATKCFDAILDHHEQTRGGVHA